MLKRRMKKRNWEKLVRGTRGAISILLAILMLPFFSIAALLVETGRFQSTVRGLDHSIGSSAYSALSDYDSYLLERFGLLAVSQTATDVNEALTEVVSRYLNQQKTTDMRSVEVESVQVDGVYPLSDIRVLKQQIQHSAAITAPTKMTTDVLDLDSLLKQLEDGIDCLGIIEQFTSGVELLEKEVELLECLDDAKKQMTQVKKDKGVYDDAFAVWQSAVAALISHLNTPRPADGEGAADTAMDTMTDSLKEIENGPPEEGMTGEEWDEILSGLLESAESARSAYESSVTTLYGALDTLQEQVNDTLDANTDFHDGINDFVVASGDALIDAVVGDDPSDEVEVFADNASTIIGAVHEGAQGMGNALGDVTKQFSVERLKKAVEDMLDIEQAVAAYDTEAVSAADFAPTAAEYHYADLEGLANPDDLNALLQTAQQEAEEKGALDMLLALVEIFNALFNSETLFDAELNVRLDRDYYDSTYGGLPSERVRTDSFYNPYEAEDQQRSLEYLEMMDPNYDPDDPYGFYAASLEGKLNKVIDNISDWKKDMETLKKAKWVLPKFRAAVDAAKSMLEIIGSIADLFVSVINNIRKSMYERTLTFGYLAYSFPNRTNYTGASSLSGYSFGKISRPAAETGTNVPKIGEILALVSGGDTNYSFRGAELEYIIWGHDWELANQTYNFILIYLMRTLLDLPFVLTNSEVLKMLEACSAVPYVGPVLAVLVGVAIALTEPFLDTYVLVNGGEATVAKAKIYLTPSGVPDLLGEIVSISLTKGTKETIVKNLSEITGVPYTAPPSDTEKKDEKKPLFNMDKWGENVLSFDYTQHTLFLMLLFGSEKAYLSRAADMIQCEATMKNRQGASVSQTITGKYDSFDLDKSYTTLRVAVDAKLKQILPVMTFSDESVMSTSRVLYRGY